MFAHIFWRSVDAASNEWAASCCSSGEMSYEVHMRLAGLLPLRPFQLPGRVLLARHTAISVLSFASVAPPDATRGVGRAHVDARSLKRRVNITTRFGAMQSPDSGGSPCPRIRTFPPKFPLQHFCFFFAFYSQNSSAYYSVIENNLSSLKERLQSTKYRVGIKPVSAEQLQLI